jgi:hypothetical protein
MTPEASAVPTKKPVIDGLFCGLPLGRGSTLYQAAASQ